ncbi:MAG TPA: lipocalin family protein [Chitinophagales bacterium]|nr:lipocalin family protein [Chitinophagales bacterium]
MKIVKHSKVLVCLVMIGLLLTGCKNKSELLLRTWAVNNLKYSAEISPEKQPEIDRIVEELRNTFRITYNADGTYNTTTATQQLSGKWKLNWNSSVITSTDQSGDSKEFKILELSETKFNFKAVDQAGEVEFEMIPVKEAK